MRQNLVTFENVIFRYATGSFELCNLDFSVHKGEWIKILGPNGSGKTTLLRLIQGLLQPKSGNITRMHDRISAYFGPDPENALVGITVDDDVRFGLEYSGVTEITLQTVSDALTRVGLDGFESRLVHTLSSGEQLKLAVASFLALNAHMMIFDESTELLDFISRSEMYELLFNLWNAGEATIIEVDQRLLNIKDHNRIIFLDHGTILFDGSSRRFMKEKLGQDWLRGMGEDF